MTLQLCGALIIIGLVGGLIAMARHSGKQAARLKELKRELDAISRAQELANDIGNWDDASIRERLHSIANRQK